MQPDYDVVVIGAGAAGLFAATEAAERHPRVLLVEKNRKPGIKILASGGSRCNVTSTLPIRELGLWFGKKGERFLRYGLHEFGPMDVRRLLEEEGVATAEYPLEKVFPTSGRAADVLRAFLNRLERSGAELALDEGVQHVEKSAELFVVHTPHRRILCRRVIVTTGGASFPRTGTTGDGYPWLTQFGHTLVAPRPALVPLVCKEKWIRELTGIAVEDVLLQVRDTRGRVLFKRRRPLLFTHRGLSGPGPMDVSGHLNQPDAGSELEIDWLPDRLAEDLETQFVDGARRRTPVSALLPGGLPRRLAMAFLALAGVDENRTSSELTKKERRQLIQILKSCRIKPCGDEGFDKAEVTAGGVLLDEINSQTMESRLVAGLHVAGEILDLDGPIGGFNFQSAFSTGLVAGRGAASALSERSPKLS